MKISYNWLSTFIDTGLPMEEMCEKLTMSGLEVEHVEKIETIKGGLEGLVVGKITTVEKHPNADKLNLTKVDIGAGEDLSIVCGAPNVAKGQKVVVAPVGTTIYPTSGDAFKIKKAKIRGEVSMGMICAEDEIGVGEGHDGIIVLDSKVSTGSLVKDLYENETDYQIEIAIIPNRGDAISHLGVARELQALTGKKYKKPSLQGMDARGPLRIEVKCENLEACPRYAGISIDNVKIGPSPKTLRNRLLSIGIKPINNVVDITNFVQHELGQPLHAFDYRKISGSKIIVRNAVKGEKLITLDEVERDLEPHHLVVCNENEPMALAGILGGLESGVNENTTQVFIESAYFSPGPIRKTAKELGLNTDSSYRFERGCNPEMVLYSLQRAANLICQIAGGEVASEIEDFYPNHVLPSEVAVRLDEMNKFIGVEVPEDDVVRILNDLEIKIKQLNGQNLMLEVPKYRSDVTRPVDIYEEIIRIYGFDKIPIQSKVNYTPSIISDEAPHKIQQKISGLLAGMGFKEIMTNSLTSAAYYSEKQLAKAVPMLNPLSQDMGIMRMEMLNSAIEAVAYNVNRKNTSCKFFEFGKAYFKTEEGYAESDILQLTATGERHPEHWSSSKGKITNEQLRDVCYTVFSKLGVPQKEWKNLFDLEKVSKDILKEHQLKQEVVSIKINWTECLNKADSSIKLNPIPIFPEVRRDLSLVLEKNVGFDEIEKIAKQDLQPYLQEVRLFDVYEGKPLKDKEKSFSVAFFLSNPKKTMEDREIDALMSKLITTFESKLKAVIRK